jgi:hypothetical protein
MMVELVPDMNKLNEENRDHTYQRTVFPEPAAKQLGKWTSGSAREKKSGEPTFTVDP